MEFDQIISKTLLGITMDCINVPLDKGHEAIQSALEKVGKLFSADRGYIFDYDFKKGIAINTYEWCNDGIEAQIDNLQESPLDAAPDWIASHRDDKPVIISNTSILPQSEIKNILEQQGIKSLISVPIFFAGELRGFIGFDSVKNEHTYSTDDIELIHFLGEILINFKTRINASEELKRANNQLEKKVEERTYKLKTLNERLLQIEEEGKKSLASDLHDGSVQTIGYCLSKIKGIRESKDKVDWACLLQVQNHLEQVVDEMRSLIFNLSPPILEDFNIETTIDFLVSDTNIKQNSKFIYKNCMDAHIQLEKKKQVALYRIVKELITNVLKHSGSDEGLITIANIQQEIIISVEDKGCGFDPHEINKSKDYNFGLLTIAERLEYLDGRINIVSAPCKGTKITLAIPF